MAAGTGPLTLGEILDRTVQLYRRNFALLVGIALLPAAAEVLFSGSFSLFVLTRLAVAPKGTPPQIDPIQSMLLGLAVLACMMIGVPLLLAAFSIAFSALNFASFHLNRGEKVTVRESYRFGLQNFWRSVGILTLQIIFAGVLPGIVFGFVLFGDTILTTILAATGTGRALVIVMGLLTFVLIVALGVVSIWIWVRFSLSFAISVAEGQKAWPSLQRSGQLSKGSRGRIFVMYLLVFILMFVATYVLAIPLDLALGLKWQNYLKNPFGAGAVPIAVQIANLVISFFARAFVMPIYAVALMLFYTDQRTRLEGYDIEQLMAQAGWSQIPQVTQPVALPVAPAAYPTDTAPQAAIPAVDAPPVEGRPSGVPPFGHDTGGTVA